MISRVLEPEVMDTAEEAAEYDAMDHSLVNARFVADFLAAHGPCRGSILLDVGTGTALIPIELCRSDPSAKVLAVDLAEAMLAVARKNVDAADLAGRIDLRLVDAKGLMFDNQLFEAVISNSIIHHIPEPGPVMDRMARLVAAGGTLFVRDLARPGSEEALQCIVDLYASGETARARQLFTDSLRAALTIDEVRDIVRGLGLPTRCVEMTSDRHWTWSWSP